ncbi:MAG: ABC transporter substrate-binding protein, partial [Clostridiales bacterium]|nr:ABC transporter substrate-binding protein [Clostridiales bacterium]
MIQADLNAIGINVNIVSLDQATLKSECQAGDQQMFLWRWNVLDRLDEIYTELFKTGFASNYHHYSDQYVDDMAVKILTEKDQDARLTESVDMQKYLAEECPQVPLYVANLIIAYRNGLTGTYFFGGGNHNWNHAYIDLSAAKK